MHPARTSPYECQTGTTAPSAPSPMRRGVFRDLPAPHARQSRAAARCQPTWKACPAKGCRGPGGILPATVAAGAADPLAPLAGHAIPSAGTPETRLRQFFPQPGGPRSRYVGPQRPGAVSRRDPYCKPLRCRRRTANLMAFGTPRIIPGRRAKGAPPSRHVASVCVLGVSLRDYGASHHTAARRAPRFGPSARFSRTRPFSLPARRRGEAGSASSLFGFGVQPVAHIRHQVHVHLIVEVVNVVI